MATKVYTKYSILEKIVENHQLPILFIGSGISKRYLYKFPKWDELLKLSFLKFDNDIYHYQMLVDKYKRQGCTEFQINSKIASYIENEFNKAFYDRKIKFGKSSNPNWVNKGISPYKMFLSYYFKKMNVNKDPKLQSELSKLRLLKNKVSAIITTNYDTFIEDSIFNEFDVFIHQNELFSNNSYNIAEIYKIHGSVSDANSIVITEQDYINFSRSRKLIIAKMLTLFAQSPIIFLGYSLTDEDIRGIIVDFLSCLTDKELHNIDEHFIFISYKNGENSLNEIKRNFTTQDGIEIPITEIQTDNFYEIYSILDKIMPGISPLKVKETKRIIKTIVDQNINSNQAESVIVGLDDLQNLDLVNKPLAIAIGYRESILNKYGYGLLSDDLILEDILFNNKKFDNRSMCNERFKSISSNRLLPVFKYAKGINYEIEKSSKLTSYINLHNSWDKLVPRNISKTLQSIPEISNLDDLSKEMDSVDDLNKKSGILLKNIRNFEINQIRDLCKILFSQYHNDVTNSTNFKRCVMYIDLCENNK